jgi:uncharacterized membrane protein
MSEQTRTAPGQEGLTPILERNIEALYTRRKREAEEASWQDRLAGAVTRFTGSMPFVYLHLAIFGFWIVANLHWLAGVPAWDESFVILAMVASVEAIFLSTFVLITQNRMAAAADKRADLDLQISLLAEHEITELSRLLADIAHHLGVTPTHAALADTKREVAPDAVLDRIEKKSSAA